MKLVTAIIQPFMTDKLARALYQAPVTGYTVIDCRGSNIEEDSTDYWAARVRVEIAVEDESVKAMIDLILNTVGTHQQGDGMIFVTELLDAINIQTGLRGTAALSATD